MIVKDIPVEQIVVSKRQRVDKGDIGSLAHSMQVNGLLQPIVVTEGLELVSGERRLLAAKLLGWKTIPAHILVTDQDFNKSISKDMFLWYGCLAAYRRAAQPIPDRCEVCGIDKQDYIERFQFVPAHRGGSTAPCNAVYLCANHRMGVRELVDTMYTHRDSKSYSDAVMIAMSGDEQLQLFYNRTLFPVHELWLDERSKESVATGNK
jgi:hypothetical protein